ncbi:MAG: putative lipid II flippase FtsW [Deltaproteobacteria bacterium]|nr:putative lipid II flippase FtsW [Candidatus Anaeroferrophillus wilburensis]MBN2888980.1 putative lipid II flippase FtsW [Deltaproteobacteria bacterium]
MKRMEIILLSTVACLLTIGVLMIFSASAVLAKNTYNNSYYFLFKQLAFLVLGGASMMICWLLDYHWWEKLSVPLMAFSAILLIMVLIPGIGHRAGGASRWLQTPFFSIQPAECCKLVMVIYLGAYLTRKEARMREFKRGLLPPLLILGMFVGLLMLEPDFGTSVIILVLAFMLSWIGGARVVHLLSLALLALPGLALAVVFSPYRMKRILTFLDPWQDPTGNGFQVIQSMIALGVGGINGVGLGNGKQKLFFLPEPHTDFIVAAIGEEMGFMGICFLILVLLIFLFVGLRIALASKDRFGLLLATGLTFLIVLQMLVNMGVAMGVLPTKGLTYPFLSYGGTSLLISMTAVGILLNICRQPETGRDRQRFFRK